MAHDIFAYFFALLHQRELWIGGGLTLVQEVAERVFDWKPPKWLWVWTFIILGFVAASFMAWREEKQKATEAAVYLRPDDPVIVVDPTDHKLFRVGKEPQLNLAWGVFGQHPALHLAMYSICYIRPDAEFATQDAVVEDFKGTWAKGIEHTDRKEYPNLFPGTERHWGTCASKDVVSDDEVRKQILYGDKTIFIVSAVRFDDDAGEHEAHACKWVQLQPQGQQEMSAVVWHECHQYTTQIDIRR